MLHDPHAMSRSGSTHRRRPCVGSFAMRPVYGRGCIPTVTALAEVMAITGPPLPAGHQARRLRDCRFVVAAKGDGSTEVLAEAGGNRTHRCRCQPAAGRL